MKDYELKDFYKIIPNKFKKKYRNPHKCPIKHPSRVLMAGPSGCGKTSRLINIIENMPKTFNRIVVCCKSKDEPIYEWLDEKLGDSIEFFEGTENIPDLDYFGTIEDEEDDEDNDETIDLDKNDDQILVVFDDLVNDKQGKIRDYFIRGRKVARGITCIFLTQSYFMTDKTIRNNCNHLILFKSANRNDMNLILRENGLCDLNELIYKYEKATTGDKDFLLICHENKENRKFHRNFKVMK